MVAPTHYTPKQPRQPRSFRLHFPYEFPLLRGIRRIHQVQKKWKKACASANLTIPGKRTQHQPPKLSNLKIASDSGNAISAYVDLGTIGNTAKNLEKNLEVILAVMGAYTGRVERLSPATARLTIEWERRMRRVSAGTLRPGEEDDSSAIDITSIEIDLDQAEDGEAAILLTKCLFIGGESESGKSNTVWHLLSQLNQLQIPYRLSVIDPAGGVELNDLEDGRYTRRYVDRAHDAQRVIDEFYNDMENRLAWMKSKRIRTHNPSETRPLEILIIDELLLCRDQLKDGALSPLGTVLSSGRKARFIVWACSQLGQKETIGQVRDLFVQRLCLRTKSQELTDAVLGTGATGLGATCHTITRPGQGFVWTDTSGQYIGFTAPLIVETTSIADGGIASPTIIIPHRRRRKPSQGKTFVYQLFDSYGANDSPCYVGISDNPRRRMGQHEREWPQSVWSTIILQRAKVTEYPTRTQAEDMETKLIDYHQPKWNIRGLS